MGRKKKNQEAQPNETIESALVMEVWEEDASNSGTEKADKFIALFGKERYSEIFGERYEEEFKRTFGVDLDLSLPEDTFPLAQRHTIDEILARMDSSGNYL